MHAAILFAGFCKMVYILCCPARFGCRLYRRTCKIGGGLLFFLFFLSLSIKGQSVE